MSALLQPSYWLTIQPPEVGGWLGTVVFGVFLGCLVLGIVGRIVVDRRGDDRYKKDAGGRISSLLITMGTLGVILFFFSFEGIQLFGARFWYPVWGIGLLVWTYFIVCYVKYTVPVRRKREQQLREQGKYLPRQHRH